MKKRFITILFVFPLMFHSQNYREEVLGVGKNFSKLKNYSLIMHYQLFLDGNLSKPFQERNIDVKRLNNNMLMRQSTGLEVLENENFQIIINEQRKQFSAIRKDKDDAEPTENVDLYSVLETNIDSITKVYDKIKLVEKSAERVKYELTYKPNDQIEKIVIVINKLTKMYESVTTYYKKPVKVEELDGKNHIITLKISYNKFKPNGVASDIIFNEKNYLTIDKKGKINPIKKYAGYELYIPQ